MYVKTVDCISCRKIQILFESYVCDGYCKGLHMSILKINEQLLFVYTEFYCMV